MPRRALYGLLAVALLCFGGPATAASGAPPAETPCAAPPAADWRAGEQWAWSEICQGRTADFAERYGGGADPAGAASWPAERTISAGFLAAILQRPPWRDALTPKGLRLSGVRMDEPLDLTNAGVPVELRLENSLIAAPLILAGAHSPSRMSFDGSHFAAALDLARLELSGRLTMRRAVVADLALGGAMTGDDVDLTDLAAAATVALGAARIAGALIMSRLRAAA